MLVMPHVGLRIRIGLLACIIILGHAAIASADPKPLSKEEQAKVDKAIKRGVRFLKRLQRKKGDWSVSPESNDRLGQTLLPAYALLEAGVSANDPAIQKAAAFIRSRILKVDNTYETSLALLFLDRLDSPKDKPLIRSLSLRLVAGLQVTGGWGYVCPTLNKSQEDALLKALGELSKHQEIGEELRAKLLKDLELPRALAALPVFRDSRTLPWRDGPRFVDRTDNSNTQFAVLGLWVAQRHDVPVLPALHLVVERFERSQQANGWWTYAFFEGRAFRHPSMICAGLLGLAVGRGLKLATPGVPRPGAVDLPVLTGLAALSHDMSGAAAGMEWPSAPRGVYYLWSVERVAMLYDLPTIGDKDWYRWGAGILLASQNPGGEWRQVLVSGKEEVQAWDPRIITSFALLFLKRTHPMKELTPKLPFTAKELNQGIARVLSGDAPLEPSINARSRSEKSKR